MANANGSTEANGDRRPESDRTAGHQRDLEDVPRFDPTRDREERRQRADRVASEAVGGAAYGIGIAVAIVLAFAGY